MSLENVKYDAFISYRHCELDKFNAMTIHRKLENFKLPKSLYGKTNGKTKIERVFRDQDELPLASNLSDPIEEALRNSEFLIVICTPRLPESQWCAKEIETFIQLHGRDHVLAVLAEGEPEQSFPEQLRFVNKVTIDEFGNEKEEKVEVEPLAADTRGTDRKSIKKQIDNAIIRLAAPIFNLNYDDLKQRHKEQRTKKIITVASIIAAVFFVFAMVCMGLALRINSQKNTIEDQYAEIEAKNIEIEANSQKISSQYAEILSQNEEIIKKNAEITAQSEEISRQSDEISKQYRAEQLLYAETMADVSIQLLTNGQKKDAIYALRNAMPDTTDSSDKPYSVAAEKALTDVLGIYNRDCTMTPDFKYELLSTPRIISVAPNGSLLAAIDSSSYFYVFNTTTGKEISRFRLSDGYDPDNIDWISDTTCIYHANDGIHAFTVSKGKDVLIGGTDLEVNDYVISHDLAKIYVYEYDCTDCCSYVDVYSTEDDYKRIDRMAVNDGATSRYDRVSRKMEISESDTQLYILSRPAFEISYNYENYLLTVINLPEKSGFYEELSFQSLGDSYITDNALYFTTTNSTDIGKSYNTVVHSIDVITGEKKWEKEFVNSYLKNISYGKSGQTEELIIDGVSQMEVINAETGESIMPIIYDDELCRGYIIPSKGSFTRLMITDTGSIMRFVSETNQLYDETYNYYKYIPAEHLNDCVYNAGRFYFCYNNESYIAGFSLTDNNLRSPKEIVDASDYVDYAYFRYVFSYDHRYALITCSSESGYKHTFYDLKNEEILCTVEDRNGSAGILFDTPDKFFTYSPSYCLYSSSGELLNSVEPYTDLPLSANIVSNNGKYIICSNISTGDSKREHKVYSSTNAEFLFTVTTEKSINTILSDDVADRLFLIGNNTVMAYSFSDASKPVASTDIDLNYIYKCIMTSDGKYLLFNKMNNDIDVYDAATLSLIKTLYCSKSTLSNAVYLKGTDEYLLTAANGYNCILDKNLECKKIIYDCVGYNAANNSYITNSGQNFIGYIENISYESLIKKADQELDGYEPSDFIKDKFHIE